jgi:hypothetical protein
LGSTVFRENSPKFSPNFNDIESTSYKKIPKKKKNVAYGSTEQCVKQGAEQQKTHNKLVRFVINIFFMNFANIALFSNYKAIKNTNYRSNTERGLREYYIIIYHR